MLDLVQSTLCGPVAVGIVAATMGTGTAEHVAYAHVDTHESSLRQGSSARPVYGSLTQPMHREVDFHAAILGSFMAVNYDEDTLWTDSVWADQAVRQEGWIEAERSLVEASELEDGWCGEGSYAAKPEAVSGARALLSYLEDSIPEGPAPSVSLDADGVPVLSWQHGELYGSLSVFDEDAYAFYVERGGESAEDGDARVSAPLSDRLLMVLQG